jgi:prepilin peptidase CpaA
MNHVTALQSLQILPIAVGIALLCMAVWQDVATRLISNQITVAVAVLGLAARLLQGDVLYALPCAVLVFIAAFSCWQMRWLGGGDAKLITAAVLLPPVQEIPLQIFAITLAGAALALAVVFARPLAAQHALPSLSGQSPIARVWRIELWRLRHGGSLPYAAAIMAGTLACLLMEGWTP